MDKLQKLLELIFASTEDSEESDPLHLANKFCAKLLNISSIFY